MDDLAIVRLHGEGWSFRLRRGVRDLSNRALAALVEGIDADPNPCCLLDEGFTEDLLTEQTHDGAGNLSASISASSSSFASVELISLSVAAGHPGDDEWDC